MIIREISDKGLIRFTQSHVAVNNNESYYSNFLIENLDNSIPE